MRSARSVFVWSVGTALLGCSVGVFAGTAAAPDISGTWILSPDSPPPADGPPLKERYVSAYKASRKAQAGASGKGGAGASAKCRIEGMPGVMAGRGALEILQTPGQVTVLAEYMTQTRRIYLDGSMPALEDISPGYMGYSGGKWQGNTLEVQTVGIREDVLFRDIPHSAKMKILEKIHLTAPDVLQDEITLIDPDYLTGPYRLTFNYKKDSGHRIAEYVCDHKGVAADEGKAKSK
jgi:hypothetical protein